MLSRAWRDLRHGENVGAYATIVLALGLSLASLFALDSPSTVASLTLGILALLCVAILVNRHQNQQLLQALEEIKGARPLSKRFLASDCDFGEILRRTRASREVWLWGTTMASHIPALLDEITAGSPIGPSLKVLLLEPSSSAVAMAAYRASSATADDLDESLRTNIRKLKRPATPGGRTIECRVTDYLAPYAIYGFDPESPTGEILVRLCNFRGSQNQRPTFWLSKERDPYWFDHFVGQFLGVWNVSMPAERSISPSRHNAPE